MRDKEGVIPAQLRTSFTQKGFNPGSIWKWGQREDSRKTSLKMSHKTFPTQTHMKIINEGILKVDITVGGCLLRTSDYAKLILLVSTYKFIPQYV